MEEKRSVWKETLKYGLIMALVSILYSVLTYMLDLTFKTWIVWPGLLLSLVVLFLLLRSYRDTYNHGYIAYGKSVGVGVIICLYAGIIGAIYAFILFSYIDPGLVDKQLALAEEKMIEKGVPEGSIDAALAVSAKFMKPWITSLFSVFTNVFYGLVMSLIVSIFIKKEANPLLEEEVKE